jgi:membrane protease subunit (stomatin/prohibitin family)
MAANMESGQQFSRRPMGNDNIIFLELIEWFDQTGTSMAARIPEKGSGEIKWGAQLVVRESQAAVFFYRGRAIHVFGPGTHTLKTGNIPILNKIMGIPWGFNSPLRAEVYFTNMKVFTNQKWGTRDPVAFRDSELGLIRLRAFGQFTVRVLQPILFVNFLVGTVQRFGIEDIEAYLSDVIVSRFNDYLGENLDSVLHLPSKYDEIADGLQKRLQEDFGRFGLGLPIIYINSITPPLEVQKAIDDRSKLGIFKNLDDLAKMKAAMAMEKAAENPGTAGGAMGIGLGMMMPAMLQQNMTPAAASEPAECPDCKQKVHRDASFCPFCGNQMVIFLKCQLCGKNLPPMARFCVKCGHPVHETLPKKVCSRCKYENLSNAVFCNQCGERL